MLSSTQRMYVCKASAGTGKTYTLAAHYIALLLNGIPCKNILAVTFTNKATEEMKQRIITQLNAIAYHSYLADTQCFMNKVEEVAKERGLTKVSIKQYSKEAQKRLQQCMSNFDDLSICTIDSFLQTLFSGLAQAIGQAAGFGVDLDLKHAITTAVDKVLSIEIAQDRDIEKAVVKCLKERLSHEDKWDLRPKLIQLTEQLYHENVQQLWDHIPLVTRQDAAYAPILEQYAQSLGAFKQQQEFQTFQQAFLRIRHLATDLSNGTGEKNYNSFFGKCESVLAMRPALATLGDTDYNRFTQPDKLPQIDPADLQLLHDNVAIINQTAPTVYAHLIKYKVCREYLNDLLLAGYVMERILNDQKENNTILLCETAYKLMSALDKHDAQFILMKAGIRYQHIMLDEFQDTSSLQWTNFQRLLEEILSVMGGSALIVGDVKQSIYRWRNGDYEIMNNLDNRLKNAILAKNFNPQQLICNRRSRQQIVQFNLETFAQLSNDYSSQIAQLASMYNEGYEPAKLEDYYVPGKTGGYVCLRQFTGGRTSEENEAARQQLLEYMFQNMETLLQQGYRKKDMLILTRTAAESKQVIKTFNRLKKDETQYPQLHQAGKIISNDSFLLESSIAVNTIICGLKWIVRHDDIARTYITINHPQANIAALDALRSDLPFTDLVEQIIRCTLCDNQTYSGNDVAFINCLQDKIRGYIGKYGSNVADFLQYWDDKMHAESIPATDSDDIRIMTIHSSKGLQAKNIFLPFCAWKQEEDGSLKNILWCSVPYLENTQQQRSFIPVSYGNDMAQIPEFKDLHDAEQRKQFIDALNLLYVACTRAEDNLFILVNKNSRTGKSVGWWLTSIYGESRDWGTMQYPQAKEQSVKMPEPFSFELSEEQKEENTLHATYHSSAGVIQFRQSNLTQQMMRQTLHIEDNADNIAFGNLCHAILEKVQTAQDVNRVVHDFFLRGAIPSPREEQQIITLLNRLMNHPVAGAWFSGQYRLLREDTVLTCQDDGQQQEIVTECRMDRVMIQDNEVIVLDYKFGKPRDKYITQVQNYMRTMHLMGYTRVKGYLWYGFQGELQEITL